MCDTSSIITINGTNAKGVPAGINIEKYSDLWFTKPNKVTPKKILKLNPKVTTIWAVGVNVYGTIPNKFISAINIKIVKIKGKY